MPIKVFMDGETDLEKLLVEAPDRVVLAMLHGIDEGQEAMLNRIHENLTGGVLQRKTGTLEESVQPQRPVVNGLRVDSDIKGGGGDAYYGQILSSGVTFPYLVERPFVGEALEFVVGGETLFRAMTEHPAMPARDWFFDTLEEFGPLTVNQVQVHVQEEIEKR